MTTSVSRFTATPAIALASLTALTLLLSACSGSAGDAPSGDSSLISADRCAENKAAGPITFLTSYNYVASPGLLDVITAKEQGLFADLCLDVTIQPGSNNAQLVSAGTAQFAGVGSPSDVMVAIANGADISGIATYGNTTANSLLTMPSITSLTQLEGTTVGYKGAIPPQISAMLAAAGVDSSKINWVSVGYDPTILPQGQVTGLTAYKSNEPLVLAAKGEKVTEWDPASYDVKSAFNTQIVNNTFKKEHPTAVEDFLRASLHAYGWINESDDNLTQALGYASALSDAGYDMDLSRERWKTEVGLVEKTQPADLPIGGQNVAQWTPEADMLVQYKLVPSAPDLSAAIDTSFIDAIYTGTTLIWPAS
ncbi:ABC transporter substrate-binding protein [Microbacterium sp. SORGH_AS_0888]|uniref:ABC transporter substrate-binding protein n=1 Tax=Microbacterium sp. SORGH_AS_0888 TaxID=3041791 RepID=UPI0027866193|nr:ABC transporter substrate-binding protein [Microbacterium sp. SORGH_AS_0888]MDQ1131302.1 putative hydroxymethylpyrimidine transport system substrate-binding protein [Microbacterium sp. SORGH_AS_0888]